MAVVRKGVASAFLAERADDVARAGFPKATQNIFISRKIPIRQSSWLDPGQVLPPFRAYLQERQVTGAKGKKNWLFFGRRRHVNCDFSYEEDFDTVHERGGSHAGSTAPGSRDQAHKVYVQKQG